MSKIKKIKARQVLDSRGNPTIEVDLLTNKSLVIAIVPSGASTGKHEALELRDNKKEYNGKGVLKAVSNVNKIAKKIIGLDCTKQKQIDTLMLKLDGTENKSKLGANSILGVSLAVCKAAAQDLSTPLYKYIGKLSGRKANLLPIPQMNIINSGKHAGVENDIQEHMILPIKFKSFNEALRAGTEVYHELKKNLKNKYGVGATLLGDEGGFAPPIKDVNERLELIQNAIEKSGYNKKIFLALDCAASEFYRNAKYIIQDKKFSSGELIDFYKDLVKTYNIISIEAAMSEHDWHGRRELNLKLGKKIQLVGDDLLVTNVNRINRAIQEKSCNSLLLKVNQIGTVTEAINAALLSFKNKWTIVVSHRSGETEDTFIADLVVGLATGQSKFGAPARSERTCKYNQLLKIEEELSKKSKFNNKIR